ncbi:hypothetical protein AEGHOMDF_3394 [Methylobacterium soli]|nr:hypothetical protein AEGHOMDF_3394 [Methylobacterium soli]
MWRCRAQRKRVRQRGSLAMAALSSLLASIQPPSSTVLAPASRRRPVSARMVQPWASPSWHSGIEGSRLR